MDSQETLKRLMPLSVKNTKKERYPMAKKAKTKTKAKTKKKTK